MWNFVRMALAGASLFFLLGAAPVGREPTAIQQSSPPVAFQLGAFSGGTWFADRNGDSGFDPGTEISGWGSPGDVPVVGDWNGDGLDDLGVFSGGTWFLDRNGDRAFDPATEIVGWGIGGWAPVVGDWNGDGATDLGAVTPESVWFLDLNGDFLFDPASEMIGWGSPGDIPMPADWNGDGRDELAVYSNGVWFIDFNGNHQFDPATDIKGWGIAGWAPITGDWNGDGVTDLGAVTPESTWFIDVNGDLNFDPATEMVGWGSPSDQPVPGDWNGDGSDEVAVYSNGTWFIDYNGDRIWDPATEIKGWGSPGDSAQPGRWAAAQSASNVVDPPNGQTGVPTNRRVIVKLPAPVDPASVDDTSVKLERGGVMVDAARVLSADNRFVSIRPDAPLAPFTNYTVTIAGLTKPGGGVLLGPLVSTFQTSASPDNTEIVPYGGAITNLPYRAIPTNASLYFELTPSIDPTTFDPAGWAVREEFSGVSTPLDCTIDGLFSGVSCTPTQPLWVGATHEITGPNVQTVNGRGLKNPEYGYWSFVAGYAEDHTPPQLLGIAPPDGSPAFPLSEEVRVIFDEQVHTIGPNTKIAIEHNGVAVPILVKPDQNDPSGTLVLDPIADLLPATQYKVVIENVRNLAGLPLPGPITSSFTTNTTGFQPASAVISPPHLSVLAKRPVIRITFNRPIVPGAFTSERLYLTGPNGRVSAQISVSGPNQVSLTPTEDLVSFSSYKLQAGPGLPNIDGWVFQATADYTTGDLSETTPPSVEVVSPPDGATSVPANTGVYIRLSEAIDPESVNAQTARLMPNQRPLQLFGTDLLQLPDGQLLSGSSIELDGIRDLAGNAMPRFVSSFSVSGSSGGTIGPVLQSTTPASGAGGVPLGQTITLLFDKGISPRSLRPDTLQLLANRTGAFEAVPAELISTGTSIEIRPQPQLLPNTQYMVQAIPVQGVPFSRLSGYSGLWVEPFPPLTFTTGVGPMDQTPPQVLSINPADGATIQVDLDDFSGLVVEVAFSEAINPSTLSMETVFFQYNGREGFVDTFETFDNARKVRFRVSGLDDLRAGTMTVLISEGVKDVPGNGLADDFISQFTLEDMRYVDDPIHSDFDIWTTRPQQNATNLPANTTISLLTTRPFVNSSLHETLYVTVNGRLVDGSIESLGHDRILQFAPTQSFQPGDAVQVIPRQEWVGAGSGEPATNALYPLSFGIAPAPASQPPVVVEVSPNVRNLLNLAQERNPTNSRVMARFSEPLDPQSVNSQTAFLVHIDVPVHIVPTTVALGPEGDVIELTPQQPLALGKTYDLTVTTGVRDLNGQPLTAGFVHRFAAITDPDLVAPKILSVSPPDGFQGVPLNSIIKVRFDEPVNPVTVRASTVRVLRNGQPLPMAETRLSNGSDLLTLVPLSYLAAGAAYTVEVNGVSDAAGNPVSPKSWSFVAGDRVDITPPEFSSPPLPQGNHVGTNSQIVLRYSEAIDQTGPKPGLLRNVTTPDPNDLVPGTISFSADGKTMRFTPEDPLVPGDKYTVGFDVLDLTNDRPGSGSHFFTVGAGPDLTPPTVLSSAPAAGATNVSPLAPLNVQLSEYIDPLSVSPQTVKVLDGGLEVQIETDLHYDLQTIKIYPVAGLPRGRTLTVRIQGVADTSGNAIATPYEHTFTTKAALDFAGPNYVTNANWPAGVPRDVTVKIAFTELLDPASVNASTIYFETLQGAPHPTSPVLDGSQRVVEVSPATPLAANTSYRLVLGPVTDLYGNHALEVTQGIGGVETNADLTDAGPPTVVSFQPADGAVNVPVNTVIDAVFSEPFDPFSFSGDLIEVRDAANNLVDARRPGDPPKDLAAGATYTIRTKAAMDFAGNPLAEHVATFTTSASGSVDTAPPQVLSQNPLNNQRDVPTDITITIDFDEPVIASGLVFRQSSPFADKAASMTLSPDSTRLTIQPAEPLIAGMWYSLYVMITDAVGNHLITPGTGGFFAFSFQAATASLTEEIGVDALRVVHSNPPAGATRVIGGPATLTLSAPLDPAALSEVFLELAGGDEPRRDFSLTGDGLTLELALPSAPDQTEAKLSLTDRARDLHGIAAQNFESEFQFGGKTGAESYLTFTRPPMGSQAVSSDAKVYLGFSAPLDPLSLPASVTVRANGIDVTGSLEAQDGGRLAVFTPDLPWRPNAEVRVHVDQSMLRAPDGGAVTDWVYELRFGVDGEAPRTAKLPDTAALEVPVVHPADGTTDVALETVITVAWEGPLEAAGRLRLETGDGAPVPFRLTIRANGPQSTATVTPHQPLEAAKEYRVTVVDDASSTVLATFATRPQPVN